MPVLFWSAKEKKVNLLCGQGVSPRAATITAFRDLGLDLVPGTGPLAACVPGAFDAWMTAAAQPRHDGSAETVLSYAIDYAERGHPRLVAARRRGGDDARAVHPPLAELGQHLAAGWARPETRRAVPQPCPCRHLSPARVGRQFRLRQPRTARSMRCATPGTVASWPRRSTASAGANRCSTVPAASIAGCSRPTTWPRGRATTRHRSQSTTMATRSTSAAPGARDRSSCSNWRCLKGYDVAAMDPLGDDFVHTGHRMRQARLCRPRSLVRRSGSFVDVPMDDLLSETYTAERRKLIGERASLEIRPGAPGGRKPKMPALRLPVTNAAGSGEPTRALESAGAGEPDAAGRGPTRRRYLPSSTVDGPLGQYRFRHAVRRLAAELADHPRARLLPRHAGPDVLAGGRACQQPRAGQASAHHAVAVSASRATASPTWPSARRAATSRTVVAQLLPAPCASWHEPAGGDRRAHTSTTTTRRVRSIRARRSRVRSRPRSAFRPRRSRRCASAGTTCRRQSPGRTAD